MHTGSDYDVGGGRLCLCSHEWGRCMVPFMPSLDPLSVFLGNPEKNRKILCVLRPVPYLTRDLPG